MIKIKQNLMDMCVEHKGKCCNSFRWKPSMNWQYPLLAPSVCYPQMVWGCMCLCVYTGIARNELICGYATVVHASSSFHPHTPFEDCEPTGLKVDIANELIIHKFKWIKASLAVAFLGDTQCRRCFDSSRLPCDLVMRQS